MKLRSSWGITRYRLLYPKLTRVSCRDTSKRARCIRQCQGMTVFQLGAETTTRIDIYTTTWWVSEHKVHLSDTKARFKNETIIHYYFIFKQIIAALQYISKRNPLLKSRERILCGKKISTSPTRFNPITRRTTQHPSRRRRSRSRPFLRRHRC